MSHLYRNLIAALAFIIATGRRLILSKPKKTLLMERLRTLDENLFFYQDLEENISYISKPLKTLLKVKEDSMNLTELISYIYEEDRESFTLLCSPDAIDNIGKIRINSNLVLLCNKIILNHSNSNSSKAFFLFFSDITKATSRENQILYENEVLQKDLAHKNNILNTIPVPIWSRNIHTKINYFNNAYNRIVSDLNADIVNHGLGEISKQEKNLSLKAIKTKSPQKEEAYIVVNGSRCLYELQVIPIPQSEITVGIGYDITSNSMLRKELQMHIAAQADLLESTANASAIYDSRTRLMFFNQSFVKLWGLDEKWLLTQPTYGEVLEKLREKRQLPEQIDFKSFKNENTNLFHTLVSTHNEFLYLPDGRYIRAIVIPHTMGGLLFSYEDITDKLALEKEYKTLSAVQKETIDYLSEGISVFSENGKLQISNKRFATIWDLDTSYLNSKPHIKDIIEKISKDIKDINLMDTFINNINARATKNFILSKNNGTTIDVLFVPLPDGATLISYHDITDSILVEKTLTERNDALQDADRLKTEFLANVSYELRSPLTSIIGFAQALDKQYFGKLNDLQAEYVTGIADSSQYLLALINDILDLASIDAGYMQLDTSRFDIYDTVTSLLELVQERVKDRKLKFVFSCNTDIGYMHGDIKRIKQVLFKLISNSIDNSTAGQTIKFITKAREDGIITFRVEDNGTTITPEESKYIFDKFSNIETKTMKSKTATLGLALVKNFVEMHNGTLTLNLKKNKGCIFECQIPRDPVYTESSRVQIA